MEEGLIKTIVPTECPHCKNNIFVEFVMTPTKITEVFTTEDMNNAKTAVLSHLRTMDLETSKMIEITDWVTDSSTVFGPKEVPMIIKSISEDNK